MSVLKISISRFHQYLRSSSKGVLKLGVKGGERHKATTLQNLDVLLTDSFLSKKLLSLELDANLGQSSFGSTAFQHCPPTATADKG